MKYNVYITRRIPNSGIDLLKKECNVEINPYDRLLSTTELIEALKDKDGMICTLGDKLNAETLNKLKGLKGIANYAVGYNNIDIQKATELGIPISNTPDVLTKTTAELAWSLLLSVSRRIVETDNIMRNGKWKGWSPLQYLGIGVNNKTLGIIGAGRIGTAMAKMSKGFEMDIVYYDPNVNDILENELKARKLELEDLLKEADFISIHTPLNENTRHLITEKEIRLMKETAFIINTSRGPVIKEKDLVKCLSEKVISGAGLDVYEFEPEPVEGLCELNNVVITPHIGSATSETRDKMGVMAAGNLLAMLKGEKVPNIVNTDVYK
ncbi:MAG: 2-hydroxyacid dehydrogenase [Spirochaetota bacterium]